MVWQRFKIDDRSKPLKALPKPAANSFLTAFSSRGKILGVFFIAYDGSIQLRTWTDGGRWKGWEVRGPGSASPRLPLQRRPEMRRWPCTMISCGYKRIVESLQCAKLRENIDSY
jgi:hypothetical protein